MSSTFTQLYVHIIFAVSDKKAFLKDNKESAVYDYISNLVDQLGHQMLIINGTSDHIHMLVKMNPTEALSDFVREIKRRSSYYINHTLRGKNNFSWHIGYSAFTHQRSQVNAVFKYIEKQKDYHKNINFKEEYLSLSQINDEENTDDSIFKYKYQ